LLLASALVAACVRFGFPAGQRAADAERGDTETADLGDTGTPDLDKSATTGTSSSAAGSSTAPISAAA